ncbi:hypothetical protein BDK51DRAFT_37267, partial [Blyttiomyces helicus]
LYIAHSLSRHFDWSHNIVFLTDLPVDGTNTVILSGSDHIVPSRRVRNYLLAERARVLAQSKSAAPPLEIVWLDGAHHGGGLLPLSRFFPVLLDNLYRACGVGREEGRKAPAQTCEKDVKARVKASGDAVDGWRGKKEREREW